VGGFSIWHWAVVVGYLMAGVVPLFLFQRRLGQKGWFSLLAIIPVGLIVVLFALAYSSWEPKRGE